jgi:hypothetical protein
VFLFHAGSPDSVGTPKEFFMGIGVQIQGIKTNFVAFLLGFLQSRGFVVFTANIATANTATANTATALAVVVKRIFRHGVFAHDARSAVQGQCFAVCIGISSFGV